MEKRESTERRKKWFILCSSFIAAVAMMLVDGVLKPPYFIKSLIKIAVFGGCLGSFLLIFREKMHIFRISKKHLLIAALFAAAVYGVIIAGYYITRTFIDYSHVTEALAGDIGVNKDNFLYVSLYISFVNSLLEEVFFRGYAFLVLRKYVNPRISFCFSALLFALYHGGMMDGWFNIWAYLLMLVLLVGAGAFFNLLDRKTESVVSSWLPHMFANFGINTVGFILFGVLQA